MDRSKGEKRETTQHTQKTIEKADQARKITVAVVGFGTMGRQIAQVFAQNGHLVYATDPITEALKQGTNEIENGPYGLKNAATKGKISNLESVQALERILTTSSLTEACKDAELVVEAAIEDPQLKHDLFRQLDHITGATTILASNTSTLSITKIATATEHPERVIGTHFFNPAQISRLVEIVKGHNTSQETLNKTIRIVQEIGKTPIITRDEPGFVANRLGLTLFLEASRLVDDGTASIQDVDTAMRLGYGHPMGPFETADLVGLDTRLRNLESLYKMTGDTKWLPPETLREIVNQGFLGDARKKTGSKGGYYEYHKIQRQRE